MSIAGGTVESISKMVWLCASASSTRPSARFAADHPRRRDRRYRVALFSDAKLGQRLLRPAHRDEVPRVLRVCRRIGRIQGERAPKLVAGGVPLPGVRVHHAESDVRFGLRAVELQRAIGRRLDATAEIGRGCAVVVGQILERLRQAGVRARKIRILVDRLLKQIRRFRHRPARPDERSARACSRRALRHSPSLGCYPFPAPARRRHSTPCAVRDAGRAPP